MKALPVLTVAALISCGAAAPPQAEMQQDVDRLVRAAEKATGRWPRQPPPPVPEVSIVARHGRVVVPLLIPLLSDAPDAEGQPDRWRVQQQAALALSRIYGDPVPCGATYCDGDPPERIGAIKAGWLRRIAEDAERRALPVEELLIRFRQEPMFWRQFQFGRTIADAGDRRAIARLEPLLTDDDRHVRGNAAFVLARLGNPRGFQTIADILTDTSPRRARSEFMRGRESLQQQIRADRYYAAHLLGDVKDPRGVDLLVAHLHDEDIRAIAPWALAEIGDPRAIAPLIQELDRDDPSVRVYVMSALETLRAQEALPRLRELLQDTRASKLGDPVTVAEAARHAIAVISRSP